MTFIACSKRISKSYFVRIVIDSVRVFNVCSVFLRKKKRNENIDTKAIQPYGTRLRNFIEICTFVVKTTRIQFVEFFLKLKNVNFVQPACNAHA